MRGKRELTYELKLYLCMMFAGMVGLAPKCVRLDPKFEKSETFSDQILVHLAHRAKCTEI